MRSLLWLLVLLAFFGSAALLHGHWIESDHAQRDKAWEGGLAALEQASETLELPAPREGWSRVVIGRPSGAEPVLLAGVFPDATWRERAAPHERPTARAPEPLNANADAPAEPPPADPPLSDFELRVSPGQTLSQICERFYGTSQGGIVERLAHYNGLSDPNRIGANQLIHLPEREKLASEQ